MIASLPMYDLPELRALTDAWWTGLARALAQTGVKVVPQGLRRGPTFDPGWYDPLLLFSQCCGYDLTHDQAGALQLIATPCYASIHCRGPYYRSLVVVRNDCPAQSLLELRHGVCAVNYAGSHSGYNALRYRLAPLAEGRPFFRQAIVSGSHARSLAYVATGQADCTAVDCVSYALLQRHRPQAVQGLRVLARSPYAPGLPYVTAAGRTRDDLKRLRAGLYAALSDPLLADVRAALLIAGAEELPLAAYRIILAMEEAARLQGYATLA
jgi:ABC-type phosphate/phosphonate transport system substrate-binding protein